MVVDEAPRGGAGAEEEDNSRRAHARDARALCRNRNMSRGMGRVEWGDERHWQPRRAAAAAAGIRFDSIRF
jgi:hypothetical protein